MFSIAKFFGEDILDRTLDVVDPLIFDSDKYKQRAGAEILVGLLRGNLLIPTFQKFAELNSGSKHWSPTPSKKLWQWTANRFERVFAQIKPETILFWEEVFQASIEKSA